MSWNSWIDRNCVDDVVKANEWDVFCEEVVKKYDLRTKRRFPHLKDLLHCFILFWDENKRKFKRYNSESSIGKLLDITHPTVLHYRRDRKKSSKYDINTRDIMFEITTFSNNNK